MEEAPEEIEESSHETKSSVSAASNENTHEANARAAMKHRELDMFDKMRSKIMGNVVDRKKQKKLMAKVKKLGAMQFKHIAGAANIKVDQMQRWQHYKDLERMARI